MIKYLSLAVVPNRDGPKNMMLERLMSCKQLYEFFDQLIKLSKLTLNKQWWWHTWICCLDHYMCIKSVFWHIEDILSIFTKKSSHFNFLTNLVIFSQLNVCSPHTHAHGKKRLLLTHICRWTHFWSLTICACEVASPIRGCQYST